MQGWIIGILAAAVISAILMATAPESTGKKLLGMACGAVMALAVLSPLYGILLDQPGGMYAEYEQILGDLEKNVRKQNEYNTQRLISENLAAYIENKAAEAGVRCRCAVTLAVNEYGTYYPYEINVRYAEQPEDTKLQAMRELIFLHLGIPQERQNHRFGSTTHED